MLAIIAAKDYSKCSTQGMAKDQFRIKPETVHFLDLAFPPNKIITMILNKLAELAAQKFLKHVSVSCTK